MEYLDPWTSRAFAVADHQIAHVYVRDPADLDARPRRCCAELPGVDRGARRRRARRRTGLDHARSGELVAVAEPDAWFTYYYWLDDARAPGLRAAGRDPPQARLRPGRAVHRPAPTRYVKVRAAAALARKKLGMRYRWRSCRSTRRRCAAATAGCPTSPTTAR